MGLQLMEAEQKMHPVSWCLLSLHSKQPTAPKGASGALVTDQFRGTKKG